jgi:hypothetical protein
MLAQFIDATAGQVLDRSRSQIRSRCYEAPLKRYTVTVGGTATTGTYSFDVDGTTVAYEADTGEGDTNTTIAIGLYDAAIDNDIDVLEVAVVSRDALVLTLQGRQTGDSFTVDNAVVTGPGTLTIANPEDGVEGDLELGITVCLDSDDPGSIHRPTAADTKAFGIVVEGGGLKKNTGDPDDVDAYAPGSAAPIARKGPFPIVVEEAVSAGDPVYFRNVAATGKVQGQHRNDDGGVHQVTRGDVAFSTTDAVGLTVDSLPNLSVASNTSDDQTAADLRDAWNASAQHAAVATATINTAGAESYIILTFLDFEEHTVTAYSPATADITGITNTTEAVEAQAVLIPNAEFIGDSYTDPASGGLVAVAEFNLPG